MGVIRSVLGIYSYLFHALFSFFLLGVSLVSLSSGSSVFRFHLLPLDGKPLAYALIGLAAAGLLLVLLAMKGVLRRLFFLWSLVVLVLVLRGYFFSNYTFMPGSSQLTTAAYLLGASAMAVVGARLQLRPAASRR